MLTHKTPWIILLLLWMTGSTYWHVCRIKQLCYDSSPAAVNAPPPALAIPGIHFSDPQGLHFSSSGNLSFAKSGAEANYNGVQPLLDSLALYLQHHPSKRLQLTGLFAPSEKDTSRDLGTARANAIRLYLQQHGVNSDQLIVQGDESNDLTFIPTGDSLYGGIRFAFLHEVTVKATRPAIEDSLANAETYQSFFQPINLYFKSGQTTYIRTAETQAFFTEAQTYLNQHPDQKLLVTGHSDNVGNDLFNLSLSEKRARSVKAQLVKAGIPAGQIRAVGKGETQPVASNDTEAGRRANRRTTVVIQN